MDNPLFWIARIFIPHIRTNDIGFFVPVQIGNAMWADPSGRAITDFDAFPLFFRVFWVQVNDVAFPE